MDKKRQHESLSSDLAASFRAFVLEASEDEFDQAVRSEGGDPVELLSQADQAIEAALAETCEAHSQKKSDASTLHQGLSALLRLLRRQHGLSDQELADKARIEVEELRRIEFHPNYTPRPRTIYQLEQYFDLPERTLVLLSGSVSVESSEFEGEVLRFAAHSRDIGSLSRRERKLLNQFVRFLGDRAKKLGK